MRLTLLPLAAAAVLLVPFALTQADEPAECEGCENCEAETKEYPAALDFKMKNIDGKPVHLGKQYAGEVVLIVNTASECGYTPQYKGLQKLHEQYAEQGLAVLGFPCNQFGGQEPGDEEEIKAFCERNYGVEFDMFAKIEVNGEEAAPLYKHLKANVEPKGEVQWNFEKFLIDQEGRIVKRYRSKVEPATIAEDVEALLEQQQS